MSNPVSVSRLEVKSHDSPDEVRSPNKTRVEVVGLDGFTLGRMILEPGWRWSECVKPVVKTELCQVSHVGHCVSGRLVVKLKDGTEKTISAGESYTIPPGHDAWNAGSEKFVCLEVLSADVFAKPA
jgi:mannose-6-phosphate isomerase-like protein (cupin superfamily)